MRQNKVIAFDGSWDSAATLLNEAACHSICGPQQFSIVERQSFSQSVGSPGNIFNTHASSERDSRPQQWLGL
jgi:hypothetical protein